jgi:two-component system phosphate regulon response regulator PhoB
VGLLSEQQFDLVLTDIKMRVLSGIDLLRYVRRTAADTRVILMTAYASLETAVEALREGASDYVIKPFKPQEVRERVFNALYPRHHETVQHEGLLIDFATRRVAVNDREIELAPKEYRLLAYLVSRPGEPVPYGELLLELWGGDEPDQDSLNKIKSCAFRLRQKLGDAARSPRYIVNVRGIGYQFGQIAAERPPPPVRA